MSGSEIAVHRIKYSVRTPKNNTRSTNVDNASGPFVVELLFAELDATDRAALLHKLHKQHRAYTAKEHARTT